MNRQKFLVVLDTMWGEEGFAPRWFHINPRNRSGARLYKLTGAQPRSVWVTNACRESVSRSYMHGTPDAAWLHQTFEQIPEGFERAPLLVCGRVAERTYRNMALDMGRGAHRGAVVFLPHPAARSWTRAQLRAVTKRLARLYRKSLP